MAVEASHISFFPSHNNLLTNMDFLKPIQPENASAMFPSSFNQLGKFPAAFYDSNVATTPAPFYYSDPISVNKSDSGLTTYNVTPAPRKRPISGVDNFQRKSAKFSGFSSPIDNGGFDSGVVQQQQQQEESEIDRFVADHARRVMAEMEQRRRRQATTLVAAIEQGVARKMKEKDEEIAKIGELNWLLQEKVQTLSVENQIWRELAEANAATANSLRSSLEHVLLHAHVAQEEEDVASSCGDGGAAEDDGDEWRGKCRKCGERESAVLLLPCRHLCLCTACGTHLIGNCPVCNSVMSGSVHVNMF